MFIDARIFSPTRLIRTTVNTENGHFSVFPSQKLPYTISPGLWTLVTTGHLASHCLFPCHNHVLTAYSEPCSNNYRFLRVNTILLLKKRNCKIARKFDFDKAVFLPIDPCMVWDHFKMPVTSHSTPQPPKGMEWYTEGVPFLSKMVCGKVRAWTSGLHRGQTSEHARRIAWWSLHSIWKIYTHVARSSCGQEQRNFLCISRNFTGDE